jgi:hypothetical protein
VATLAAARARAEGLEVRARERGVDPLRAALRDRDPNVRRAASEGLAKVARQKFEAQLKQTRERAFGPTRQGALVALLFTYRDLSEPDLERYARFMESDAGNWYLRTLNRSLIQTVGVLAERTGAEVVRVLPAERWQGPRAAAPAR